MHTHTHAYSTHLLHTHTCTPHTHTCICTNTGQPPSTNSSLSLRVSQLYLLARYYLSLLHLSLSTATPSTISHHLGSLQMLVLRTSFGASQWRCFQLEQSTLPSLGDCVDLTEQGVLLWFCVSFSNAHHCRHNDHYQWQKVTSCIHNVFGGQRWVDQYGEVLITNGNKCSCKLTFEKVSI